MFKMFKLIHPEKEFAKEFEIGLIRENSRRLQLLFGFVGMSQIVFIIAEAVGAYCLGRQIYLFYQTSAHCFLRYHLSGLIQYANKIESAVRSVTIPSHNDFRCAIVVDD